MRNFLNAKSMAVELRRALAKAGHALPHSACLELVAKQFGLNDWNTLSTIIARAERSNAPLKTAAGWYPAGTVDPKIFRMGLDPINPGIALIESLADSTGSTSSAALFGCLMQSVSAESYRGRKLLLTAEIRGFEAGLGTIWMRIDGEGGQILRFDNMMERSEEGAIAGSTGWTSRSIILDVPNNAVSVHYGFFLKGTGQLRARNFDLSIASEDASVTEMPRGRRATAFPKEPVNLRFLGDQCH